MLLGAAPCHLTDELLTVFFQRHRLIAALIDEKEATSCFQILISYACYHFYYFLNIVSKCYIWLLWCLLNAEKPRLKHPLLILLLPSMLQYIGLWILWSACSASMVIQIVHSALVAAQGHCWPLNSRWIYLLIDTTLLISVKWLDRHQNTWDVW